MPASDQKFKDRAFWQDPGLRKTPTFHNSRDLQDATFPPIKWIVPNVLPEGLTLLAGKPKFGKSWMALQMALGVASGDTVLGRHVEQGQVLYVANEDNKRRLKSRVGMMLSDETDWPASLTFATGWPRLDQGGLTDLQSWTDRNDSTKLLIIDTLATVRPSIGQRDQLYQSDYDALRGLHQLANEKAIALVVIHHVRKMAADDPFDIVSGSTGLTGAADSTLVLANGPKGKVLYGRGRDLPELEIAVQFDAKSCISTRFC